MVTRLTGRVIVLLTRNYWPLSKMIVGLGEILTAAGTFGGRRLFWHLARLCLGWGQCVLFCRCFLLGLFQYCFCSRDRIMTNFDIHLFIYLFKLLHNCLWFCCIDDCHLCLSNLYFYNSEASNWLLKAAFANGSFSLIQEFLAVLTVSNVGEATNTSTVWHNICAMDALRIWSVPIALSILEIVEFYTNASSVLTWLEKTLTIESISRGIVPQPNDSIFIPYMWYIDR